jgi:sporulation protein YlmC with PRC-barrel domain
MENDKLNEKGLFKLKDLKDYEVAKSDPDVREWDVYSNDKKLLGKVEELIVDPEKMKVRYLNVHLNEDVEKGKKDRFILIPVGAAELDERREAVYIKNIETITLLKMPEYGGGEITRDYETDIRRSLRPDEPIPGNADYYNSDLFDENKFYGSRRRKLHRLKDLDESKILTDKPDVRGWKVFTLDGEMIGRVDDLLLDEENKIRYLDIERQTGTAFNESTYIIIPVGLASLGIEDQKVLINMKSIKFKNYPAYNGKVITPGYEESIFNAVRNENETAEAGDNLYVHKNYNNEDFLKKD